MAYTERYVTVTGAGLNDGTSEANAWSFAQMIAAAPSGATRVNIKSGSYSVGAYTVGAGTAAGAFVLRGYNTTIGDLDTPTYNADGSLDTTDFPDITITSLWTPSPWCSFQNLDITGSLSSAVIGNANNDNWAMINCRVVNTQNNGTARCLQGDNNIHLISSDFACTGASHASVVDMDTSGSLLLCRVQGTSSSALFTMDNGNVHGNMFYGNSSSVGIAFQTLSSGSVQVMENTFYNLGTVIQFPNAVNTFPPIIINNIATGCSKFIDGLYSATADVAVIVGRNRTRNITTMYTGVEAIEFGAITTAGSDSDDYTDAGAGNFRPPATAPGVNNGMRSFRTIGAFQRDQSGTGGGGVVGRLVNSNNLVG